MARLLRVLCPAVAVASAIALVPTLARADVIPAYYPKKTFHIKAGETWTVPTTGTAEIVTETITIDGTIDADGLGEQGMPGADGKGMGGGVAGQGTAPGGGAGFFGKGGPGIDFADASPCSVDPNGGAGGLAFVMPNHLKGLLGSAGGGSATTDRGGPGGGHIIIKATTVILNGKITASAIAPGHENGYAGGGSGGVIEIHAFELTGSGKIQATGAPGADSSAVAGGGGSGGVVLLDLVKPWSGAPDVSGGAVAGCAAGDGEKGTVIKTTPPNGCIDADGDNFFPAACAPKGAKVDCDDSNKEIFPGAVEACDGKDNDCNGKIDDDLAPDACPPNAACVGGACATQHEVDAGMKDAGAGAQPDRIDFEGGCDVTPAATVSGFAGSFAALAGLGLLLRRRARRVRGKKRG